MPYVMISNKKCTGCHMCELACSAYHEGAYRPSVARLYAEVNPTTGVIKGHTCLQSGCSKCQEACPNDAISAGDMLYLIDPERCTECVGAEEEPQCKLVCPADCISVNPDFVETPEQLMKKYQDLHA